MKNYISMFTCIFQITLIFCFPVIITMEKPTVITITNNEKEKNIFRELPAEIQRTILMYSLADFFITPKTLVGHTKRVYSAATHDNIIVTCSEDNTAKIWNMDTGLCQHTLNHGKDIGSIAINSMNRTIVTASYDNTAKIWDLNSGVCLQTLDHKNFVYALAISPDNTKIITGSWDGTAKIWDHDGNFLAVCGEPVLFNADGIYSVAISSDNKYIVTGARSGAIKIWDIHGNILFTGNKFTFNKIDKHKACVIAITITSDNQNIITGTVDGTVKIWDMEGILHHDLIGHKKQIKSIVATADAKHVITSAFDGKVKIWNIETGALVHSLKHTSATTGRLSCHDKFIAAGYADGTIKLWDINSGLLLHIFGGIFEKHTGQINTVITNSNNMSLISTSADGTAKIWPLYLNLNTQKFNDPEHPLFWIKHNINHPQADLIKRICAETQANIRRVINFPSTDAKILLSFPKYVRTYLLKCLNIMFSTGKM